MGDIPTPPSTHWAANDTSPLARRIREHVSDHYDGGPPFLRPIPDEVWRAAEAKVRGEMWDAPAETAERHALSDPKTAEPWAKNRNGDPRQLLQEAELLDTMARLRRHDAARSRAEASAIEEVATQYERAAADYRRWAAERRGV